MATLRKSMTRMAMHRARRNPRAMLRTGAFAARHPRRTRRILNAVRLARRAPDLTDDRAARRHMRAATDAVTDARRRARRLGSAAVLDQQFLRGVLEAARESAAVYRRAEIKERRRRRMRRLMFGAGAIATGTIVGRRRMASHQHSG
jgi:hypothetical protein